MMFHFWEDSRKLWIITNSSKVKPSQQENDAFALTYKESLDFNMVVRLLDSLRYSDFKLLPVKRKSDFPAMM